MPPWHTSIALFRRTNCCRRGSPQSVTDWQPLPTPHYWLQFRLADWHQPTDVWVCACMIDLLPGHSFCWLALWPYFGCSEIPVMILNSNHFWKNYFFDLSIDGSQKVKSWKNNSDFDLKLGCVISVVLLPSKVHHFGHSIHFFWCTGKTTHTCSAMKNTSVKINAP